MAALPGSTRDEIIAAALRVYARSGFRGATTRRIADAAGVNEVTIFRHFGSKSALLSEALGSVSRRRAPRRLPAYPRNVVEELPSWAEPLLTALCAEAPLILAAMADAESLPGLTDQGATLPQKAIDDLSTYLSRARDAGMISREVDAGDAAAVFVGALLADALTGGLEREREQSEATARRFAFVVLRALGADDSSESASDATGALEI